MAGFEFERRLFDDAKSALTVTVYGSYSPNGRSLLDSLKECLRKKGYVRTKRVMDYDKPDRHNETDDVYSTKKSFYWLKNSNVNILVFFCDRNEGVTAELTYLCQNIKTKLEDSAVFIEKKCFERMSSLIRGQVSFPGSKLYWDTFTGMEDLCDKAASRCLNSMKRTR